MTDIVDMVTRSRMMASIKGKNTKPERIVRQYLHAAGLRFRLQDRRLPGTPDLVLRKYRTVVFIHGCFWHRHQGCRYAATPSTRADFWTSKFDLNVARDARMSEALRALGWRVLTIWECEVRDELALDRLFWKIVAGCTEAQESLKPPG